MENNKPLKYMAYILVVSWMLSMIPLVLVALYAHPWADDFSYGITTAEVWRQSQSLFLVIQEAWAQTWRVYQSWQGSFSAVFLMLLQPAVFGEQFYSIAPISIMTIYTVGVGFLLYVLLCRYVGANRYCFLIVTCSVLILSVQFMYCPVEGFYWYNGSVYYTFFHSLGLILLGLVLLLNCQKKLAGAVVCFLLSILLAFFVGGGNYSTALLSVILLAFFLIQAVWKKAYKNAALIFVVLFFLLAAFFISIASPGNAVRQAQVGQPNAIKAILTSFVFGGYSIFNALNVPTLLTWLFLLPVLYSYCEEKQVFFSESISCGLFLLLFLLRTRNSCVLRVRVQHTGTEY